VQINNFTSQNTQKIFSSLCHTKYRCTDIWIAEIFIL